VIQLLLDSGATFDGKYNRWIGDDLAAMSYFLGRHSMNAKLREVYGFCITGPLSNPRRGKGLGWYRNQETVALYPAEGDAHWHRQTAANRA
jgi:hypothetical protein